MGRRRQLAEFVEVLNAASAGHGELVVVAGDAGMGKTRLAEEMASLAGERGVEVAWSTCWEPGGTPAFWPWAQLLRQLLATDPDLVEQLGPVRDRLTRLVPEAGDTTQEQHVAVAQTDPEFSRFELFDGVVSAIRKAAARRPRLLVIDDLHRADASSVLLLSFLGTAIRTMPAVMAATYRHTDMQVGDPLGQALPELLRHGRQLVPLEPVPGGGGRARRGPHRVAPLRPRRLGPAPAAGGQSTLCPRAGPSARGRRGPRQPWGGGVARPRQRPRRARPASGPPLAALPGRLAAASVLGATFELDRLEEASSPSSRRSTTCPGRSKP